ncbi:hypothetical protein PLESTB_001758700 [Pleodorina starrii]|uniref:DUF4187 domain-containing protein n=1 Tax=Pleodorina starrii TaxID=330485 RepID=A0A9W6C0X0_9CHLO|nr:hypothetical protein PLESTM_000600300 [Pleodorina starrii]GLC61460.1 hypothetical protein PLESTB_001758700 [Pleodorina starrii]
MSRQKHRKPLFAAIEDDGQKQTTRVPKNPWKRKTRAEMLEDDEPAPVKKRSRPGPEYYAELTRSAAESAAERAAARAAAPALPPGDADPGLGAAAQGTDDGAPSRRRTAGSTPTGHGRTSTSVCTGSAGSGRAEPLPLDLKPGRAGVGVDEQRKREQEEKQLQEELERAKRARLVSEVQQRYTDTARSGYNARQMVRHLRGAWRVAEQLDERAAAEYDQAGMAADGGAGAGPDGRAAARDVAESEAGPGAAGVPRSTVLQALLAQLPVLAAMLGEEEAEGQGHGLAGQAGGAAERREAITCSERISQREEAEEEEEEEEAPRASAGDEGSAGEAAEGVSAREACGGAGPALVGTRVDGGARPGGRSGGGGGVGAGGGGGAGAGGPSLAGAGDDAAGDAAGAAPSLAQQLDVLLLHLRERHCYCYFCGCQYDTPDDLASSCPGLSEEDH